MTDDLPQQIDDWRSKEMLANRFVYPTREQMLARWGQDAVNQWDQWDAERQQRSADLLAEDERRQAATRLDDERRARATRIREAQIPVRYQHSTFANLDRDLQPEAYDLCRHYVDHGESPDGHPCLMLAGPPGTGKTTLACACLLHVLDKKSARFASLSRYLHQLRDHVERGGNSESILDLASGWALLVIDDLGRQRLTEWGQEQLYVLVDTLYADGRRVVFTSNAQTGIDESLTSRLEQMCQRSVLVGDDLRRNVDHRVGQGPIELPNREPVLPYHRPADPRYLNVSDEDRQ